MTHDLAEAISLGSRVIVLTSRPARVKCIVPETFAAEEGSRLSPLERRNAPEFSSYFQQIWKEVREHG